MKLFHVLSRQAASAIAYSALACLSAHAALAPQPGTLATYRDASGQEWCVTVYTMVDGPGLETWAWFSFNADPRRIEHVPLDQLTPGCRP
jgi:hypothetical protein